MSTQYSTVNLGTAPTGTGGDTNNSAFTKLNTFLADINNHKIGYAIQGFAGSASGTLSGWNLAVQQSGAITLAATGALGDFVWIWNTSGSPQTVTAPSGGFIYDPHANTGSNTTVITLQDGQDVVIMCRGGASEMDVMGGAYLSYNGAAVFGATNPKNVTVNQGNNLYGVQIVNVSGSGNGPQLALQGDGSSAPNKYVRANGGNFEVLNSAYSTWLARITEGGVIKANGASGGFEIDYTAGNQAGYRYVNGGGNRWYLFSDGTAESGSNAGSNFAVGRFDDSGNWIDNPLLLSRNTGNATFSKSVYLGGSLNVQSGGTGAAANLSSNAATYRTLSFQTSASPRWNFNADNSSESGSNAGSNFTLTRFNDSGVAIDNPLSIVRSTGVATFSQNVIHSNGATFNGPTPVSNAGYYTSAKASTGPSTQGLYMGWNENGSGEGYFVCNEGSGAGGFVMRTVNSGNTAEIGRFVISASGTGTNGSDRRLKDDIEPLKDALESVRKLTGYSYRYKASGERHYGVIAQEVQPVYPYAVASQGYHEHDDTEYLGVSYTDLVAPLIEAVKELANRNDALSCRVLALEARLASLGTRTA